MNRKKETHLRQGARVRVANRGLEGAERWHNARFGTVAETSNQTAFVKVVLDGDPRPQFIEWGNVDVEQPPRHEQVDLPIAAIRPSRWQHRRRWDPESLLELAQSIQQHGLINRLLVFRDEDGDDNYELIAGERRFRALAALARVEVGGTDKLEHATLLFSADWAEVAGVAALLPGTVPCELRTGAAADFREIVIVENLQRENCSAIEEAEAFHTLIEEEHYTHASLAKRLGKSRAYITQRLGLLGLAESVRDSVDEHAISFTAARSIATLPEVVQPAVTAHVADLAQKEGDSQATTRKVQAMTAQINTFLDVQTWQPPGDKAITPLIRNRLRLVRHHLEHLDAERTGEAIVALRDSASPYGYNQSDNLVGKKPLTLVQDFRSLATVLRQLTGQRDMTTDEFWAAAAHDQNWLCVYCVFYGHAQPVETEDAPHCPRWDGQDVATCSGFVAHNDPLVIPLGYHLVRWADQLGVPYLGSRGGGELAYLDDVDAYAELHERAAAASHEKAAQQEMAQSQAHLPALRSYCGAQAEKKLTHLPWSFGHAQAHRCTLCVHHRPELADQRLPPCHFAVEPLSARFGNETVAPAMGALVSKDGLLVPRCMKFRHRALPTVVPLEGFRFPSSKEGRAVVIHWLRTIAGNGSSQNNHNNTLAGPLAWLPYERQKGPDLDAMLRYVRDNWDDLGGDEIVARLISIALTESAAAGSYSNQFDLMSPLTGRTESWASVSWQNIREGHGAYGFPEGWLTPWVPEVGGEAGDE